MPEEYDRFADELDRMVAGQHSGEAGDLAAFAGELQGLGVERIDDAQRDRIGRRLMQHANSAASATPTTGGAGPLSQPTLIDPGLANPWVRRRSATAAPSGWRGHMVRAQTAIAIMTAAALLIVSAAWYTNQQGGDDPGPITTRYAAAPTEDIGGSRNLGMQESTPASDVATPEAATLQVTPLLELLSVLPAPLTVDNGDLRSWSFADIEQRFEDLGLTYEQLAEDPALPLGMNAYAPMAHTTFLFDFADDQEFVEAIGFNPLTVQQVLVAGAVPDTLTLLRGDWDENSLITAWEAAGYTEYVTVEGVTIWTLDANGMIDPEHPIQSRMFQQMNNVAILDGGILAYAGTPHTVELVLQTQAGEMASALDDPWMQTLIEAVPMDTVSSLGFTQPGSAIYDLGKVATNPNLRPEDRDWIEEPLRASREAVGPMPEYRGVVFSVEGDPAEGGEVVIRLRAFSDEEAEQIVRVLEWRWQNFMSPQYQRTFDSIMPLTEATTEGDLVTLRFDSQDAPQMWLQVIQGDGLHVFAVDAGLPVGTPEASAVAVQSIPEEDAYWWTWPSGDECRPEEIPEDTLEPADYPQRAYLPLGTPDREDAEAAAGVARMMAACNVHYSIAPFSSSRYYEENYVLGEDPYDYGQTLLEQNENGRAISGAFPVTDPTEFGRLTNEGPAEEPPFWIQGQLEVNRYEPFTVVYIPSQAVELADGRIAIPESLLGMEADMDQARRGDPATWVRHYSLLILLSNASGTWHIDEILPFCIGPDCDLFWEQNEEMANRVLAGATPESPTQSPAATPQSIAPIDDRTWLACPADNGPYTYASRTGVSSDVVPPGTFDPRSSWGPAEPPTIPCTFPGPMPPDGVTPVPLD